MESKQIEELARKYAEFTGIYNDAENQEWLKSAFIAGYQSATPKWISVEDRLPNYGVKVLVLGELSRMNPSMGGAYVLISQRQDLKGTQLNKDNHRYQCDNQFMSMSYVTHWMPLPTPPQT